MLKIKQNISNSEVLSHGNMVLNLSFDANMFSNEVMNLSDEVNILTSEHRHPGDEVSLLNVRHEKQNHEHACHASGENSLSNKQ